MEDRELATDPLWQQLIIQYTATVNLANCPANIHSLLTLSVFIIIFIVTLTNSSVAWGPWSTAARMMLVLRVGGRTLSLSIRSRNVLVSQYTCSMPLLCTVTLLKYLSLSYCFLYQCLIFEISNKSDFYLLYWGGETEVRNICTDSDLSSSTKFVLNPRWSSLKAKALEHWTSWSVTRNFVNKGSMLSYSESYPLLKHLKLDDWVPGARYCPTLR